MQQLNPKAVWLFFIGLILRWFIVLVLLAFWLSAFFSGIPESGNVFSFGFLKWLLIIILALLIFVWIWAKLTYHYYRYELREDGFRKEYGVIWKKYVTVPYDKIQNVDIYRGVIDRVLGLSDLHIQTAGASAQVSRYGAFEGGAEGRLPALSREVAEQLQDELVKRARQLRTTNQGL